MARKKTNKYEPPGPEELNGYSRGDIIYCHRHPDGLLSHGEIKWFYEETEQGPGFTFMCNVTGSYRMGLMKDIIENPTKQQRAKINSGIVRKIKISNQKPKKKK